MHNVKTRAAMLLLAILLAHLSVSMAAASFSSLYVFGDGVCTTTDNVPGSTYYHGNRYCNGRVWIEVLSQWQGLTYDATRNNSYFGHDSVELVNNVNAFAAPADVATALFVVWCNDADFVNFVYEVDPPYSVVSPWTTLIDASIERHKAAVNTLYGKGVRTIVMPKAVDIMATPAYNFFDLDDQAFVRARVIEFNSKFETAMAELVASRTGLVIHRPDTFAFFDQVKTNPGAYGMVNPYPDNAAIIDLPIADKQFGPGLNYIFWDDLHPTAMFQMHLAEFVQQVISPIRIHSMTLGGGNAQFQVANIPLGRAGFIQGSANLQPPWQQDAAISEPFVAGGNTTKTISIPVSGPSRFYRVGFPVVWTWP